MEGSLIFNGLLILIFMTISIRYGLVTNDYSVNSTYFSIKKLMFVFYWDFR